MNTCSLRKRNYQYLTALDGTALAQHTPIAAIAEAGKRLGWRHSMGWRLSHVKLIGIRKVARGLGASDTI